MSTTYSTFTIAKASIIATVLEAVLYGVSIPMFLATLWVLLRGHPWREIHHGMVAVACVLFVSNTIYIAFSAAGLTITFVGRGSEYPGGPNAWLSNPGAPTSAAKDFLLIFETLVADAVVIYRCCVVWRTRWVGVVPGLLWLVSGAGIFHHAIKFRPNGSTRSFAAAFIASTLACNILATGLLAYRLCTVHAQAAAARIGKGKILPVLSIILDAGALYSSALICTVITTTIRSPAAVITGGALSAIIPIAFYMVLVRVAMARARSSQASYHSTAAGSNLNSRPKMQPLTFRAADPRASSTVRSSVASEPEVVRKPLNIHIQVERCRNTAPLSEILDAEATRRY
ncbi:hypothetical protein MKEN_00861700 [Mycena kentingensis (nom. inval.)]|nr:hypothetical protein MKEN_00861700 [Mycena kentingensis (nom. inval.)]